MKKVIIGLFLFMSAFSLWANPLTGDIDIIKAYARETVTGQEVGAIYLVLKNNSSKEIKFTGLSTPAASQAEIHVMMMNNNVSSMKHQAFMIISPNKELQMLPGKSHIMLLGLKQPLVKGHTLPVTLHFASHHDIKLNIPVLSIGEGMENMKDMKDMK
ncbi:MAG TPA: copper chaperone PCu(A)C, partial [Ferrovaceae bacterium]|nr:copper chaperone PCu(A)C [Ferrovaceae bacterium]